MKNINVLKLGLIALLQISSMSFAVKIYSPYVSLPVTSMSVSGYGDVHSYDNLPVVNKGFNVDGAIGIQFTIGKEPNDSRWQVMAYSYYGENKVMGKKLFNLPLLNGADNADITMNGVVFGNVSQNNPLVVYKR